MTYIKNLKTIILINKKNKKYLKGRLKEINGLTFRYLPDEEGDSATFVNFLFPTKELTEKAFRQFEADGVGGVAYWYTNMYHFINQWDHIKNMSYPARMAIHDKGCSQDYKNLDLPKSENVMGRMASVGIRCAWQQDELEKFGDQLVSSIRKVM